MMKERELVTLEEIAQRLKYSQGYIRNNWPKLLPGVRPVKLVPNGKILFEWNDIVQRLHEPK